MVFVRYASGRGKPQSCAFRVPRNQCPLQSSKTPQILGELEEALTCGIAARAIMTGAVARSGIYETISCNRRTGPTIALRAAEDPRDVICDQYTIALIELTAVVLHS